MSERKQNYDQKTHLRLKASIIFLSFKTRFGQKVFGQSVSSLVGSALLISLGLVFLCGTTF